MKLIASAFCVAALLSVGLIAQESEIHSKQKIEVKHGRKVDVMGCVDRVSDGLVLRNVNGDIGRRYVLVGKSDDMQKHVGEWVEITGRATDRDHGKVKVESKSRVDGHEQKSETRVEGTNGSLDLPLLGVDHIRKVRGSCSN